MPVTEPQPHESASRSEGASLEQVPPKAKRTLWVYCGLDLLAWLALCFCGLFGALVLCVAFLGMPFETPLAVWSFFGGACFGVAWGGMEVMATLSRTYPRGVDRERPYGADTTKDSVRSAVELMAEDQGGGIQGRSQYLSKTDPNRQAILDSSHGLPPFGGLGPAVEKLSNSGILLLFLRSHGHVSSGSGPRHVVFQWDNTNPKSFVRPQVFRIPIVTDITKARLSRLYEKRVPRHARNHRGHAAPLGPSSLLTLSG